MSVYCPKCGEALPDDGSFCGVCGNRLDGTLVGIPRSPDSEKIEKSLPLDSAKTAHASASQLATPSTDTPPRDTGNDTFFNNPAMLLGKMVGEYRINDIIGKGGMGWVYSGIHPIIEKKVAIKVLKTKYSEDAEIVNSFINEAKAANAIGSHKIVDIFAFGKLESGNCYFVMELLKGESLAEMLKRVKRLSWYEAYQIIPEILDALEAAHNSKIIHRDLKPENIHIIKSEKGSYHVKLLDFGIAKFKEEGFSIHETTRGVIKGSPLYMSPEQCRGLDVTARSDIYSFGVILYKLFTGREPFLSSSALEIITSHLREEPEPPSTHLTLPKELDTLILRCLAKKSQERPASIHELRSALMPILQEHALGAEAVAIPRGFSPVLLFIFALALVAGAFFLIYKPFKTKTKSITPTVIQYEPLHVLTAHPAVVNKEFELGFSRWLKREHGKYVRITWHSFKEEIDTLPDKVKKSVREGTPMEYDVVFGGGEPLHRRLSATTCTTVDKKPTRCLQKYNAPVDTFTTLTPRLNGINLFDPEGYWFGTAISGFGYFCDLHKLKEAGIAEPKSWEEIASPLFYGHLVSADPTTSSSTFMIFELIIQNLKWDRGWETIISLAANVRGAFLNSSKRVLGKVVEEKEAMCGLVIDYLFYLQRENLAPEVKARLKFILPRETGIFTSDPVALVARAKNKEMAVKFIDYLLSEGQHLLIKKVGHPKGPFNRALHRLPVVRSLYVAKPENEFYINPFSSITGVVYNYKEAADKKRLFSLLMKKGLVDSHKALVKCAGRAIRKKLVGRSLFQKVLPLTEKQFYAKNKELAKTTKLHWDRLQYVWMKHFEETYNGLYNK